MTTPRDPDRQIHAFLVEGDELLNDQVYDVVRAAIERKRQRTFIGPWRTPIMNKLVTYGLGAVAVVAVLLVATQFFGSPNNNVGNDSSPTADPTAESTAAGTVEPSVPTGDLDEGPFIYWDERSEPPGPQITVTIPAPGWFGEEFAGILVKNDNPDAPEGAGMIGPFIGDLYVYADPCQWEGTAPDSPASTVDEFVTAMSAQASRDASAPVDITVGGYSGKSITVHVPEDAVFSDCDRGYFGSWTIGQDQEPYRYHQDPGQIDELWILDFDGQLMVIDTAYYAETPAGDVDEMRAIVESATFEVP